MASNMYFLARVDIVRSPLQVGGGRFYVLFSLAEILGEMVDDIFLVYCLGCIFALSREECRREFMSFSVNSDRKGRKERRPRENPTVFPLENPFPCGARRFAILLRA
jgi:hypothetical protein